MSSQEGMPFNKKRQDDTDSGGESGGSSGGIWGRIFGKPGKATPNDLRSDESKMNSGQMATPTADTIAALRIAQGLSASYASNPAAVNAALNTPTAMELTNGASMGLGPTPMGGNLESEDGGLEERQQELNKLFGKRANKND